MSGGPKIGWRWEDDALVAVLPRPCFGPTRFAPVRCKRPLGHAGPCRAEPLPDDVETAPTLAEVRRAYARRRTVKLAHHGVRRLADIPGTDAYWRAIHRAERGGRK